MCVRASKGDGDAPGEPPRIVAGATCTLVRGVKSYDDMLGTEQRVVDHVVDLADGRAPRNVHICTACRRHLSTWVAADKKAARKHCTGSR